MRFVLLTALLTVSFLGRATNYYFSSTSGDDGRTASLAQNPATPWKSLQKLNAIFPTLLPGDTVFLKRGDVFEGRLNLTKSGSDLKNLVITAYGSGAKPVISGLLQLTNFTRDNGNIWTHPLTTKQPNILLLNDQPQALGRYPNASDANGGYLTFEAHDGKNSITDNQLSATTNWTGAEVVIRKRRWVLERSPVTAHSGNTIYYTATTNYEPANNFGYFLQNHPKALDKDGEWAFNDSQNKLYLFKDNFSPANTDVEVSVVETLLTVRFQNNITVKDLHFKGANDDAISLYSTKNIIISGCEFSHAGLNAVYLTAATNITIENSNLHDLPNNGITTYYGCSNIRIAGNTITNTGAVAGMGKTGDLSYQAITVKGKNITIENNRIDNTGYVPIRFEGDNITVRNNFITDFLFVKDDGGGIYTWNSDFGAPDNFARVIKDNIILNAIGAGAGTNKPLESAAHGIYLDDNAANVEITGNTVSGCTASGLYVHNARNAVVNNNTLYDNERQIHMQDDDAYVTPVRNVDMKGNVLFTKTASQQLMHLRSVNDDIADFTTADNNYYSTPFNPKPSIYTQYTRSSNELVQAYDLSSWQGAFYKDISTKAAPAQMAPYRNNGLLSGNKVSNSTFDNNIYGVIGYVYSGTYKLELNNSGKLDGGSLQVTMDAGANNRGFVIMNIGNVTAGKTYLVKFSLRGSSNNKSMSMYLRKASSPYNRISAVNFTKVLNTRTENEFVFTPTSTESAASIVFDISDQNTLWLDNVGVYEANVTLANPSDYLRFEYNPSTEKKTVALDGNYVDAKNKAYSGSVTLEPFSSVVLLRTSATDKKSQTITFPDLNDKTYGDASFALAATASSGLPVSYQVVSGPATISGNVITITGAGAVTVEASQQGDASYTAAVPVRESFKVAKAGQSISFPDIADKTVGDAPFALAATASSNLPVSYKVVSGSATVSGNTVTVTDDGIVTIEATQAGNANYNAAKAVQQQFTVAPNKTKQSQSISFPEIPVKMYGEGPFSLKATASSGLPVKYRIVSGPATVLGNVITLLVAGTVTVEATQQGNDIFNPATSVQRTFSIVKAGQAISFANLPDRNASDAPFALTATATSTLPVRYRVVSGPASMEDNIVTLNGAGTVTIEATQDGDDNYNAAPAVQQSFAVNADTPDDKKATQKISFGTLGYKTYNSPAFELTATASSGLPVNYRVLYGPVTLDDNVVTITGVGMVGIEASQPGDDNYDPANPVVRSFEIGRAGQAIDFPVISNKANGDEAFDPGAVSSSGLPVSYKVLSGPAMVMGNFVMVTGVGRVTIEASQPGNDYYYPAYSPVRTFVVRASDDWLPIDSGEVVLTSGPSSRRIQPSATPEEMKAGVTVYPNPLSAQGLVSIVIPEATTAAVAIYDNQGRMVKHLGNKRFEKGQQSILNLNAQELPSGTYVLRVVAPGKKPMTRTFVVAR